MTVLVTGASGHVGANLVRDLLARGERVRALVHRDDRALTGLPVEAVRGDVRDPACLRPAMAGAEVVYHLAAVISIDGDRGGLVPAVNVEGVRNVAEAALAAGVRRMVHVSSIHAFMQEPLDQPLDEQRAPVAVPHYPAYDRSKAAGEAALRTVIARGLDAVIINPTGIIGPHDFAPSRMGRWFLAIAARRLPALVDGGFDWVDVRDVSAAAIAAAAHGRRGANYLIAGHWLSLRELAQLGAEVTGVREPLFDSPMWLARVGAPFAVAYGRLTGREPLFTSEALHALRANRQIVRERALLELGHAPRPLHQTVADLHRWFAAAGMLRLPGLSGAPVPAADEWHARRREQSPV
jgi:dihydroflavonol-4-reductase